MMRESPLGFITMVVDLVAVMILFLNRREIYPEVGYSEQHQIECYIAITPKQIYKSHDGPPLINVLHLTIKNYKH